MEGKMLITTDAWFYAPNGLKYCSAWGNVEIIEDTKLGIKTNRGSTNWYAYVGSKEKGIIIAGCQIHYAVKCDLLPNTSNVRDYQINQGKVDLFERPSDIYIAQ